MSGGRDRTSAVFALAQGLALLETPTGRGESVARLSQAIGSALGDRDGRRAEPLATVLAMTLWRRPVDPSRRQRLAVELSAALDPDPAPLASALAGVRQALHALGLAGPDAGLDEAEVRRLREAGR